MCLELHNAVFEGDFGEENAVGVHRAALERVRYVVNSRESLLLVELESLEISFGTKPP